MDRDTSEIFRRLRVVDQLAVKVENIESDTAECKADGKATRAWVEDQLAKEEDREVEKHRLSRGERGVIAGGVFVLLAALISALSNLIAAGAL